MRFLNFKFGGENVVVTAPTGSGKTTAVLNNIPRMLEEGYKIIFALPTKALMAEVSSKLTKAGIRHLVDNSDVRLTKNVKLTDWFCNRVIVASYEKVDSAILTTPEVIDDRTVIVVDEVHLATDDDRALAILSILASAKKCGAKVVVLSATIPQHESLAEYLNATTISAETKLKRTVKFVDIGYPPRGNAAYTLTMVSKIAEILKEDLKNGAVKPTIVFRPSRRQCETIADILRSKGFDAKAYHAGIKASDRQEIIEAFMEGKLRILVSTHALCWGVNTPAYRVIIAGALSYGPAGPSIFLKSVDVLQMAGRAGRPGYHDEAEVVIITTNENYMQYNGEWLTEREFFERSLREEYMEEIGIRGDPETIVLRLVYVGRVKTTEEVLTIPEEWYNVPPKRVFEEALTRLSEEKLLTIVEGRLTLTPIGRVVAEHYIDFKTYRLVRDHILDQLGTSESRVAKLARAAHVAAMLRGTTMKVPEEALHNAVVLRVHEYSDTAGEAVAQLVAPTGDTDSIAESIKKISFFVNSALRTLGKEDEDWWILGKTMKQLRSMLFHRIPIKDVIEMYIDGKIDTLFKPEDGEAQKGASALKEEHLVANSGERQQHHPAPHEVV
jgi:replicative superfamily II helicase